MTKIDPRIIEQFNKRAPFKLEEATLLVLCHVGSHSHNTYLEKEPGAIDDTDYMGIVIPPESYVLGIKNWDGLNFQHEELDVVFYSFQKFVQLLIKSNPNVLVLLWMKEEHLIHKDFLWTVLVQPARNAFASRRAYPAFIGYAHAQLRKMTHFDIKTQNEWDEALEVITMAGYTKEQIVGKQHREMPDYNALLDFYCPGETEISPNQKALLTQYLDRAIDTLQVIHARHFQGYMGEKRKALVRKHGYDTKNAAHLVRLMRMCCEFLETGELTVFRTHDADELRSIKRGGWTLEAVQQEADALFKRAEEAKVATKLPEDPDVEFIDKLVCTVHHYVYDTRQVG